jgi:hypothetical protein
MPGDVAAPRDPDLRMLLGVMQHPADRARQSRPRADVAVDDDLDPLGRAGRTLFVQLVERVLERLDIDARENCCAA